MSVFAPALNYLWKNAIELGLDAEKLFRDSGIDPALRRDSTARVPTDKVDELLWQARQQSGDDAFVFSLAKNLHPSFFGALGFAWLTSATLRKAFTRLQRYVRMINDQTRIELQDTADEFHIVQFSEEENCRDAALRERQRLATSVRLCRMNAGDMFAPLRIEFQQTTPSNLAACLDYFRCELEFGAESTRLVLPAIEADRELSGYDPHLVQHFESMVIGYLAAQQKLDTVGRVNASILEQLPSGDVSLESVAATLAMSPRSLTRKLADEGLAFKSMLAEIRRDLAEKYIADRTLTITEISFLLGFSETSSFSRAFKGWTGQSPRAHRQADSAAP